MLPAILTFHVTGMPLARNRLERDRATPGTFESGSSLTSSTAVSPSKVMSEPTCAVVTGRDFWRFKETVQQQIMSNQLRCSTSPK